MLRRKDLSLRPPRRPIERVFFSVPEQEPEGFSFDLESELTEERIEQMRLELRQRFHELTDSDTDMEDIASFADFANNAFEFLPAERIPRDLFTDEFFDSLIKQYQSLLNFDPQCKSFLLRFFFLFYPNRVVEYEKYRKPLCEELEGEMNEVKDENILLFYSYATHLLLLDPETREQIPCTEETFREAQEAIIQKQKKFFELENVNEAAVESLFVSTANIKLFHPKNKLPLDAKVAKLAKNAFHDCVKTDSWLIFSALALDLAVITADHIDIPSPGKMQLTHSSKRSFARPAMPDMKEY